MKQTFLFNTGVKEINYPTLGEFEVFVKGEKHIQFECENVPKGAKFLYACSSVLPVDEKEILITPIVGGGLLSTHAYFALPKIETSLFNEIETTINWFAEMDKKDNGKVSDSTKEIAKVQKVKLKK